MFKSFWETELRTGFAVPSKHALRVVYILWRHKSTLSRSRTFVNLFGGFAQKSEIVLSISVTVSRILFHITGWLCDVHNIYVTRVVLFGMPDFVLKKAQITQQIP